MIDMSSIEWRCHICGEVRLIGERFGKDQPIVKTEGCPNCGATF